MRQVFTYLESRLDEQVKWHLNKAAWNKTWFYTLEVVTIASGALIPIINLISSPQWQVWQRLGSAGLAAIIVVSTGIGRLYKFQENWLTYRGLAEELTREKELYLNGVATYDKLDETGSQKLLVQRTEEILSATTTRFVMTHRANREQPQSESKAAGKT
jgi:Protein of unknown function (DUF4231)